MEEVLTSQDWRSQMFKKAISILRAETRKDTTGEKDLFTQVIKVTCLVEAPIV